MFQPPHCEGLSPEFSSGACKPRPESNAIEQVWQYLKRGLRWKTPTDLDELRTLITLRLREMTEEVIASITGRSYVLEALSVVNI
jgi:hypothetical protein